MEKRHAKENKLVVLAVNINLLKALYESMFTNMGTMIHIIYDQ